MSTDDLLRIVADRGLSITIKDGRPVIKGTREPGKVTDRLLACLARHRDRIIERLSSSPRSQE